MGRAPQSGTNELANSCVGKLIVNRSHGKSRNLAYSYAIVAFAPEVCRCDAFCVPTSYTGEKPLLSEDHRPAVIVKEAVATAQDFCLFRGMFTRTRGDRNEPITATGAFSAAHRPQPQDWEKVLFYLCPWTRDERFAASTVPAAKSHVLKPCRISRYQCAPKL